MARTTLPWRERRIRYLRCQRSVPGTHRGGSSAVLDCHDDERGITLAWEVLSRSGRGAGEEAWLGWREANVGRLAILLGLVTSRSLAPLDESRSSRLATAAAPPCPSEGN